MWQFENLEEIGSGGGRGLRPKKSSLSKFRMFQFKFQMKTTGAACGGKGGGWGQEAESVDPFAKSIDLHTLSKNTLTHLKMSFNKKFF